MINEVFLRKVFSFEILKKPGKNDLKRDQENVNIYAVIILQNYPYT